MPYSYEYCSALSSAFSNTCALVLSCACAVVGLSSLRTVVIVFYLSFFLSQTYYLAVVGNAIMSIAWTVNLSVGEGGLLSSEGLRTALAIVEVLR